MLIISLNKHIITNRKALLPEALQVYWKFYSSDKSREITRLFEFFEWEYFFANFILTSVVSSLREKVSFPALLNVILTK